MPQTYSDGKKIYSVDMMFAYINLSKPKHVVVDVAKYLRTLEFDGWGDPAKGIKFTPLDVIKNPDKKMYQDDMKRIKNADLKYPIIIAGNYIVDGVHRLAKAHLTNKKKIKAYVFTGDLLKKFLINSQGDWDKIDKYQTYDFIEMYCKRFCI